MKQKSSGMPKRGTVSENERLNGISEVVLCAVPTDRLYCVSEISAACKNMMCTAAY